MLMSHPTWVRGLKLCRDEQKSAAYVAPYVGAWIETLTPKDTLLL